MRSTCRVSGCCAGCPGRSFETAAEAARNEGQLVVKGLKSSWRMAPLILRTTLAGALTRILMHDDVQARALPPPHPLSL